MLCLNQPGWSLHCSPHLGREEGKNGNTGGWFSVRCRVAGFVRILPNLDLRMRRKYIPRGSKNKLIPCQLSNLLPRCCSPLLAAPVAFSLAQGWKLLSRRRKKKMGGECWLFDLGSPSLFGWRGGETPLVVSSSSS